MTEAFGVSAETPKLLPGGQGTTWRAGDVILKPVSDVRVDSWIAEVLSTLEPTGYRVPRPVRALDGEWIHGGWCAWTVVEGEHGSSGRTAEILDVAQALHSDVRHVTDPGFEHRDDVWARGDRAAWAPGPYPARDPQIGELISRCEPLRVDEGLPYQVVHADLFGNVLFAEGLPPAIIDLSPYWRPAEWALAVAMVDGQAWYGEAPSDLDLPYKQSLLARAAMFRLVTSDQLAQDEPYVAEVVRDWTAVVDAICATPGAA